MIERLLASFGIDPAEIKRQAMEAANTAQQTVEHFDARLTAMEVKLDRILALLEKNNAQIEPVKPAGLILPPPLHVNGVESHE